MRAVEISSIEFGSIIRRDGRCIDPLAVLCPGVPLR